VTYVWFLFFLILEGGVKLGGQICVPFYIFLIVLVDSTRSSIQRTRSSVRADAGPCASAPIKPTSAGSFGCLFSFALELERWVLQKQRPFRLAEGKGSQANRGGSPCVFAKQKLKGCNCP